MEFSSEEWDEVERRAKGAYPKPKQQHDFAMAVTIYCLAGLVISTIGNWLGLPWFAAGPLALACVWAMAYLDAGREWNRYYQAKAAAISDVSSKKAKPNA